MKKLLQIQVLLLLMFTGAYKSVALSDETGYVDFLKKSCDEGGDAMACGALSYMYERGSDVKQDYFKAAEWGRKACKGRYALGCTLLGKLYDEGNGVKQDYLAAAVFFKMACDDGEEIGCAALGKMYENGTGVRKSLEQARELYGKTCDLKYQKGCDDYARLSR